MGFPLPLVNAECTDFFSADTMTKRTAIKTALFADEYHRKKIDTLGDPLAGIELHIDFVALAVEVDRVAARPAWLGQPDSRNPCA